MPTLNSSHIITHSGTYGVSGTTATAQHGYSTGVGKVDQWGQPLQSDSPDLPAMVIATTDEHGGRVNMTITPEAGISSGDTMKLMMLIMSVTVSPEKFNALAYVKKNNLERHFSYS